MPYAITFRMTNHHSRSRNSLCYAYGTPIGCFLLTHLGDGDGDLPENLAGETSSTLPPSLGCCLTNTDVNVLRRPGRLGNSTTSAPFGRRAVVSSPAFITTGLMFGLQLVKNTSAIQIRPHFPHLLPRGTAVGVKAKVESGLTKDTATCYKFTFAGECARFQNCIRGIFAATKQTNGVPKFDAEIIFNASTRCAVSGTSYQRVCGNTKPPRPCVHSAHKSQLPRQSRQSHQPLQ
ncbi:hypothetical protein TRVL_08660 [Trypanosoma vivax]|nr:hypothetical protein TRVL_08660 [Trypanosoma vivax]